MPLIQAGGDVTRLRDAIGMSLDQAYHTYTKRATEAAAGVDEAAKDVAELEALLAAAEERLADHRHEQSEAQRLLKELEPLLNFPKLPGCVLLSILGQLGKKAGQRAACVRREWQDSVATAKRMGMYDVKVTSVAASDTFTVVCTSAGAVFSFGSDEEPNAPFLGQGGEVYSQLVPRRVEALAGKEVIGVSAGDNHTAVWTDAGELFTFGEGGHGRLGHGGEADEHVPRRVEALGGKKVMGASASGRYTAVWTDAGELFTFGWGGYGQLGHGGEAEELVPRRVEALAGKKVMGASGGDRYTVVWTDAGELFTFGSGENGYLGHGVEENEYVPRRVEALGGKNVIGASAGDGHTAVWTDGGELFTFGYGEYGELGHGGNGNEYVPRRVEALSGKKVIGASAGGDHTAVWTDAGELFTFGRGWNGRLGHGRQRNERVPRLVEALTGQKVIGASTGGGGEDHVGGHTAVWTDAGELFTFGVGLDGQLGHGLETLPAWKRQMLIDRDELECWYDERLPRLLVLPYYFVPRPRSTTAV